MKRRPGIKLVHRFRSNIVEIINSQERLLVLLDNGKVYRSNKKITRWYKISPERFI